MLRFATIALMALAVLFSASPTLGQDSEAPSFAPTASPAPSFAIDVPQFSWDIFALPDLTSFSFTEDSDTSEIKLFYNTSRRDTQIQAFENDCTTLVPQSVITLSADTFPTSPTHADFTVDVDIHQDNVTTYPGVWTDVGTGEGLIEMCVRVDLLLPSSSTSVTFHEQKLNVSIGLIQGFEITGIELDRLNATENNGTADFDYEVSAYQCDENRNPSNEVLTQGSDVYLCVETTSPNVEIEDVRDLTVAQGTFYTTPIDADGVEDPLTETTIDGKEATIRYQIISAFFSDPNPDPINVTGSILLAFTDDDGRRHLVGGGRDLETDFDVETAEEGFSLQLSAESAAEDSSSSASFGTTVLSLIALMAGGSVMAL